MILETSLQITPVNIVGCLFLVSVRLLNRNANGDEQFIYLDIFTGTP